MDQETKSRIDFARAVAKAFPAKVDIEEREPTFTLKECHTRDGAWVVGISAVNKIGLEYNLPKDEVARLVKEITKRKYPHLYKQVWGNKETQRRKQTN